MGWHSRGARPGSAGGVFGGDANRHPQRDCGWCSVVVVLGGFGGSVLGSPLDGRERLHRQRMNLRAHSIAQRRVDTLVARDSGLAREFVRNDDREEVLTVALDLEVRARKAGSDEIADFGGGRIGHMEGL